MSNSFYGGKQGFGFFLKENTLQDSDGLWHSLEQIQTAISQRKLSYGEYALINDGALAGNLYRCDLSGPVLVGNIRGSDGRDGVDGTGIILIGDFEKDSTTTNVQRIEITLDSVIGSGGHLPTIRDDLIVVEDEDEDNPKSCIFDATSWPTNAETLIDDAPNKYRYYDLTGLTNSTEPYVNIYSGGKLPPMIFSHYVNLWYDGLYLLPSNTDFLGLILPNCLIKIPFTFEDPGYLSFRYRLPNIYQGSDLLSYFQRTQIPYEYFASIEYVYSSTSDFPNTNNTSTSTAQRIPQSLLKTTLSYDYTNSAVVSQMTTYGSDRRGFRVYHNGQVFDGKELEFLYHPEINRTAVEPLKWTSSALDEPVDFDDPNLVLGSSWELVNYIAGGNYLSPTITLT